MDSALAPNNRIRILQIQNHYNVSTSDLAEQIIQGLPSEAYDVTTLFLHGKPSAGQPTSIANRSIYFDLSQGQLGGLRLRALWRLLQLLRHERYDLVIAHRFKPIDALLTLGRWIGWPACIGIFHGLGELDRPHRRWSLSKRMTPNWRIVGVSRAVTDDLRNDLPAISPDIICQINNAIDIERVEKLQHPRDHARQLLGLPGNGFIFGCIGRLVPVKGHIDLLRAFASALPRLENTTIAIIGEGRARVELELFIEQAGLRSYVTLLGEKHDALQYIRAFDCFVMPSRSEGLPLALLEAMSASLPIIGSDIPSMRSMLEDSGSHIYSSNNIEQLAQQLIEVRNTPKPQLDALGKQAHAYLQKNHSITDFRRHYRQLIDHLFSSTRHAR